MKAIILNAGKGGRLAPLTDNSPKCLLYVGDKRIIDYQLSAIRLNGISEVVLVLGYKEDMIRDYVLMNYPDMNFKFIINSDFANTNTSYSLWLARKEMNSTFIYFNGDVLLHPDLLKRLIESDALNALAIEKKDCGEEEVKVTLTNDRITSIGKNITPSKAFGEFIGIAKFSKDICNKFIKTLDYVVNQLNHKKDYFEAALQKMVSSVKLTAVDISDLPTIEIDFPEDLERAKSFAKLISVETTSVKKAKILFYVERNLHLPFLEPIFDYLNSLNRFELAFSAPKFVQAKDGKVGIGLEEDEIKRLKSKGTFVSDPEGWNQDVTVVADVSFSLRNCGKIVNVGHGIISKGGFYRDAPIVRRENLADLICTPGEWHKEILSKNVFVPIVATGFIKSDRMFGASAVKKEEFLNRYKIREGKKIILFAPTFNPELSAIPCVGENIAKVLDDNSVLLIKLHSMTDITWVKMYKDLARKNNNIIFVDDIDLTPALVAADVMISDVSSAAVEFLFMNKPVVVYNNPKTKEYAFYAEDDIEYKVRDAVMVVNSLEELKSAVSECLINPTKNGEIREKYAEMLCFGRDGRAAERAGEAIINLLNDGYKTFIDKSELGIFVYDKERLWRNNDGVLDSVESWSDNIQKTKYVVFANGNAKLPARWKDKLLYYFYWYQDTEVIRALSSNDNYREIGEKYFSKNILDDLHLTGHYFRHFIGADSSTGKLGDGCFAIRSSLLMQIINWTSDRNNVNLIRSIEEYCIRKQVKIRQALDVFVIIENNSIFANYMLNQNENASTDNLIQRIEGNRWDLEARLELLKTQQGNLTEDIEPVVIRKTGKLTSIVLITYNQLKYSKECVDSVIKYTDSDYEFVFVDNNSDDETANWLRDICLKHDNFRLIENKTNLGFTTAANQGIKEANGDYILLLNNDTHVTEGWLERMIEVIEADEKIGVVGPISNSVSGLQIDKNASYKNMFEMHRYAKEIRKQNSGNMFYFPRVAFLCTLIKRSIIEELGGLDERFSPGNYEDDDFCLRVQLSGYKTVIAKDVFIHHYGSKSFKASGEQKYYERLKKNEAIFIDKWGATPDEIWLQNKSVKSRILKYPLSKIMLKEKYERAVINIEEKEYEAAMVKLNEILAEMPENIHPEVMFKKEDILNIAGNISFVLGDYVAANGYFEQQLKLNPQSSEACFGLGEVFLASELWDEAKTMYQEAIKLNPHKELAQKGLKKVEEIKRLTKLETEFESLNEMEKIELAESFIEADDYVNSINILAEILKNNPHNLDALNNVAVICILTQQYDDAREYLNVILKKDPENDIALGNLEYLNELLSEEAPVQPVSADSLLKAEALIEAGQLEKARSILEPFLANPTVDVLNLMTELEINVGDWVAAKKYVLQVLNIDPDNDIAFDNFAKVKKNSK